MSDIFLIKCFLWTYILRYSLYIQALQIFRRYYILVINKHMHLLAFIIYFNLQCVPIDIVPIHLLYCPRRILLLLEVYVCDRVCGSREEGRLFYLRTLDLQRADRTETNEKLAQVLLVEVDWHVLHKEV